MGVFSALILGMYLVMFYINNLCFEIKIGIWLLFLICMFIHIVYSSNHIFLYYKYKKILKNLTYYETIKFIVIYSFLKFKKWIFKKRRTPVQVLVDELRRL